MDFPKAPTLVLALSLLPFAVGAEPAAHARLPGMTHATAADTARRPTEPGQGAFAAIAEIVEILRADPGTDWSRVDIASLRDHLVDIDRLVTSSDVTSREIAEGLEMTIPVPDRQASAALRMVPAHAPFLEAATGWTSRIEDRGDTLVWTVTAADEAAVIRALGFFGLMATGDHHRDHHLALAAGSPSH